MVRTTDRARGTGIARGLLRALAVAALLLAVLCSASASARVAGVTPAVEKEKAPTISKQPKPVTVEEGRSAVFEATAAGVPTPSVQWEVSTNGGSIWSKVEGGTSDLLTIASAKTSESGDEFRAFFENKTGTATSKAVTLTVDRKPVVTKQPASVTVEEGHSAVFEAAASGFPAPTVQWQISTNGGGTWRNVGKATSDQLTIVSTKTSESGDEYRAVFENEAAEKTEAVISNMATLTVQNLPAVTKQPVSLTVEEGQGASFEATGSGFPTPTVQWEISTNAGSAWSPVDR